MLDYPANSPSSARDPDSAVYGTTMLFLFALAVFYAIAAYVRWTAVFPWLGRLF
jgi:hypothetical protein